MLFSNEFLFFFFNFPFLSWTSLNSCLCFLIINLVYNSLICGDTHFPVTVFILVNKLVNFPPFCYTRMHYICMHVVYKFLLTVFCWNYEFLAHLASNSSQSSLIILSYITLSTIQYFWTYWSLDSYLGSQR